MKQIISIIITTFLFGNITYCQDSINENLIAFFFSDFKENTDFEIDKVFENVIKWQADELYGNLNELNIQGELTKAITELDSVRKYFDNTDIEFIKNQFPKVNKYEKWNKNIMSSFTLVDSTELNSITEKSISKKKKIRRTKNNYAYIFSIPLFSKDFSKVIIRQEYYCGFLCSNTCTYIYEKQENGKWKIICEWDCWAR